MVFQDTARGYLPLQLFSSCTLLNSTTILLTTTKQNNTSTMSTEATAAAAVGGGGAGNPADPAWNAYQQNQVEVNTLQGAVPNNLGDPIPQLPNIGNQSINNGAVKTPRMMKKTTTRTTMMI